jgi:gluconate 2-dehydrogenase gamma chain
MDRRKSLKVLALGAVSGGLLLDACKQADTDKKAVPAAKEGELTYDRMEEEKKEHERLMSEKFFNEHEMATIAVLSDIIIPADEVSGSATDAGVPAFIEFMVKDKPDFQTPMRGGLRWLDMQMARLYGKAFKDCSQQEQTLMVDAIAYPNKAKPGMQQGVKFFTLMRNLTASGFYSSEMGMKDIGYLGNRPNQWNGVPDDVLKQYGIAYTDKELKECISFPAKPA